MKVWFGCTTLEWETYKDYYFLIRDELKKNNCTVLYDWIDFAEKVSQKGKKYKRQRNIYDNVLSAIKQADIIVIENTIPNFSTSHQINFALQRKKQTLVLRLHQDDTLYQDSYIESINDPHLSVVEYSKRSVAKKISEFVNFHSLDNKQKRYNIVLEKKHKYYLDWANQVSGSSRSEIIRNLIEEEMREDKNFRRYLGKISKD